MRITLVFAVLTGLALLPKSSAFAFERTLTCSDEPGAVITCADGQSPVPIAWPDRCVTYHVNTAGSSSLGQPDDVIDLVQQSFAQWNNVEGSYIETVYGGQTDENRIGYASGCNESSNANVVTFVDEGWRHPERTIALTSVSYDARDGRIYDADIELNVESFNFGIVQDRNQQSGVTDFLNTMTHESGHFLGLDHTEEHSFVGLGNDEDWREATMFAITIPGDTNKRTLAWDDEEGLRAAYPSASAESAGECRITNDGFFSAPERAPGDICRDTSGCAAASTPASAFPPLFWLIALVVPALRRRS